MIDAHCHLYEIPEVEWANKGLDAMICVGADFETSKKSIALAEKYDNVFATVGIHPEAIGNWQLAIGNQLRSLMAHKKVVAIGEAGLDSGSDQEIELFMFNIGLAKETGLPLVVHCRDMFNKVFEVLDYDKVQMHCFTGTAEEMMECVRRGWYISFGGILTFKKSDNLRKVSKLVPEDKILIETDSPYLAPEPIRGTRNNPLNVKYVLSCLENAWGKNMDKITTENTRRFFGI